MAGTKRALAGLVVAGALCLIPAPAAQATTPGANGRIAYSASRGVNGYGSIFSANPDGTDQAPVTHTAGWISDDRPAWSPDGQKIAFVRVAYNNFSCCIVTAELVVASAGGTVQRVLTGTHQVNGAGPWMDRGPWWGWGTLTWSPDSRRIAYGGGGGNAGEQIWVINADDNGLPVRISDGTQSDTSPAWSPDGTKIAFLRGGGLYTMSPTGASVQRLGDGLATDASPDWSPDGTRLVTARSEGTTQGITIVDAATGTTLRRLTSGFQAAPVWSPDGTRVAYVQDEPAPPSGPFPSNVYTVDVQGNAPPVRVTAPPVTGEIENRWPSWQPLG